MSLDQAKQRAERLVEKLNRLRADIQGGYETADSPVTIIAAELLAVQRLEREACATEAETFIRDMITIYGGKLPYVVFQPGEQAERDASLAWKVAQDIAGFIRQSTKDKAIRGESHE